MRNQGVAIHNHHLAPLLPVLQAWIDGVDQYVQLFNGNDLPYWYNERTNVGVLSGAAWKAGWVALEEFQSLKMRTPGQSQNHAPQHNTPAAAPYRGRCDLYLANRTDEFFIEAKACFPPILNLVTGLDAGMTLIEADALNVDAEQGQHLSALFCAPFAAQQPASATEIDAHLEYAKRASVDAHAWIVPDLAQETSGYNGSYYPLVSLFLKLA